MASPEYLNRVISKPVVPLFRAPDPESEQVTQALLGTEVLETAGRGEWRFIQVPDGYTGWCARNGLDDPPTFWHAPWVAVDELWIHLRATPDSRAAPVTQVCIGTRLPLVERREPEPFQGEPWVKVGMPDGSCLWVEGHRVKRADGSSQRPRKAVALCRTARQFLGIPYLWGGCSSLGLDCSGFVQLVMRLHGIELQRDAIDQSLQGMEGEVPAQADLVFFGPTDRPEAITHVGMMLDEARFIHARGGRCVCINRLAEEPYASMLRCIRRLL